MKTIEKDLKNKLTKEDYFFYLLHRNMFLSISPFIILALIVVFIFMVNKDGFDTGDLLYLAPILLFLLSYIQVISAIKKALKSNSEIKNLRVILDDKKYKEITDNGTNELAYEKFNSFHENKNYFYLYVDKVNALILPKREFDAEEINYMRESFGKHMKKTSLLNISYILGLIFTLALLASMIALIISML